MGTASTRFLALDLDRRVGDAEIYFVSNQKDRTEELDAKTGRPKADIDPVLCVSCDMCRQICPRKAIYMPTDALMNA